MSITKDAYYFPHFCNARHDRKVRRIMKELGVEGYGIFFMALEVLREQSDLKYPMDDIDLLADEFGTSEQKVRAVVCNYGLFNIDDEENFFSPKLLVYLKPYFQKSERARKAAQIRWDNANVDANALPTQTKCNASKVKKSKVNNSHRELAAKLKDVVLLRRKRTITDKAISSWANTIRLMEEVDGWELERITQALGWYGENWERQYVPVIESGKSLREKFDKLLNSVDRVSPKGDDEWM